MLLHNAHTNRNFRSLTYSEWRNVIIKQRDRTVVSVIKMKHDFAFVQLTVQCNVHVSLKIKRL